MAGTGEERGTPVAPHLGHLHLDWGNEAPLFPFAAGVQDKLLGGKGEIVMLQSGASQCHSLGFRAC